MGGAWASSKDREFREVDDEAVGTVDDPGRVCRRRLAFAAGLDDEPTPTGEEEFCTVQCFVELMVAKD